MVKTMSQRRATIAVCLAVAMTAAGCGGSSGRAGRPETTTPQPVKGGTLVLALGGEPNCADWLAPCGNFALGKQAMEIQTLPRALDYVDGEFRPSALLAGAPVLEPGPPERLTYRINPKAVWSDGVPITSSDFRYTWDQVVNGPNIANKTGFEQISTIDDSDPATAVITFNQPYAAWYNPFGVMGSVLPKHLLEGKDRTAEMRDGYRWSGGPWMIDHWIRGQEIKLVPNPAYWGAQSNLDAVVWKVIPDAGAALAAYKSGQVAMVANVPPEVTGAELRDIPDTKADVAVGLGLTVLVFNTQSPPLDSAVVRQALAFATDRDALVAQVLGPLLPGAKPVQSFMTPAYGHWYVEPDAKYRRDLTRVDQLMKGAGFTRAADGVWIKGDQRASVEIIGSAGNKRDELTEQILQSQWADAGFDVKTTNSAPTAVADMRAKGTFQVTIYNVGFASNDPSRCGIVCSRNIPSAANGFSGQNVERIADPALDAAWDRVNTEVDDTRRLDAVRQASQLLAEDMPVLPLAPLPQVLVYRTATLAGPIRNNVGVLGPFFNLNEWWCPDGRC
jgi:peptide/nickel transport system substrate-binding protein